MAQLELILYFGLNNRDSGGSLFLSHFLSDKPQIWTECLLMNEQQIIGVKKENFEKLLFLPFSKSNFHIFKNLTTDPTSNEKIFGTTRILSFLATL